MRITEIAVDRPVTSVMFFLSIITISVVSLTLLPIDLLPDVSMPSVTVNVQYPGAGPEEVETLLARPVEETMGSVNGVQQIDTTCMEDSLSVRLRFEWGTNIEAVIDDIRQRLDRIRGSLPEDAEPPYLYRYDVNAQPIMWLGLSSTLTPMELRELAERDLKPRLERVAGVAAVQVDGGLRREIQVNLKQDKLDNLNLQPTQIVQRLRSENLDAPVGEVTEGDLNVLVRTHGQFRSPSELNDIVIATRNGVPIHLRDVAEVVDGHEEVRGVERVDGKPAVTLDVVKQSNSNAVNVADGVFAEVAEIRREMPHVTISTLWDSSRFIRDAIDGVRTSAILGSLLAIFILLFFLHNIRATLIIGIAIPVSVLASFSLLYFYGFTLNIVSFGGLALGVGMLVDNSIVVLENIYRHLQAGEKPREAALHGTDEVTLAISASTLTTVVVFLPLLFLTGPAQILFGQMAYVVAFSLFCSLAISVTLLPMLCSKFLVLEPKSEHPSLFQRITGKSEAMFSGLDLAYKRSLSIALKHRPITLFACLSVLFMAIPLLRILPFEYMPVTDENEVRIYADVAPGTRLEEMDEKFREFERIVWETIPELIESVQTDFGMAEMWRGGSNEGTVRVKLVDRSQREMTSQEIADILADKVKEVPGISARARASGGLYIFRMLRGQGESLTVEIRGHDLDAGQRVATMVKEKLEQTPGISDARIDDVLPRPAVALEIDRAKAAEVGLNISDIADAIRIKFGGQVATVYREAGEEYDVRVRLQESDRFTLEDLQNLWLVTPVGNKVAASNFVSQKRTLGPSQIDRIDQERVFNVDANLEPGASLGNVVIDAQRILSTIELPKGIRLVYGGEYEDQQDSFRQLMLGFVLSLLLVYMVMAAQFESLLQPFLIMFAIPFALIGVVLMLLLTGTTLNVQSILGTTVLAGIAVNNSIILIDYTNLLRRTYQFPLFEAITESGRRRLRPILMTSLTTILGLIPMAVGLGSGSELQVPLARAVVGGLFTSTIITLFFVPVAYSVLEEALERARGKKTEPESKERTDRSQPTAEEPQLVK